MPYGKSKLMQITRGPFGDGYLKKLENDS